MATPERPNSSDRTLTNAQQARDKAQRFVDKHSKGINNDYKAAKEAYGREAAKEAYGREAARSDAAYDALSSASIFNDVSNQEADAVLRSLGINPNTGRAIPVRSASTPLPSRPTTTSSARRSPAPASTTGSNNDKFLREAEKMAKKAEADLAKRVPKIQAEYDKVSRQADALGRDIDMVQEVLSRPMRSSSVSQDQVDELMSRYTDAVRLEQQSPKRTASQAGFQSPPAKRTQVQSVEDRAARNFATSLPNVPKHELKSPAPAAVQQPKPAPTVNPNQAKIDALQKQMQQFLAQRKDLGSAENTSGYMPKLKAAVALIDTAYGTKSMEHYNKLAARFEGLQKQVAEMKVLRQRDPNSKELKAQEEKFKKDNPEFKQDLKAYTERVAGVFDKHLAQCSKEIAALKTAPASSRDNDSSSNNTPRPRGPAR